MLGFSPVEGGSTPLITLGLTCLAEIQDLSGAFCDAARTIDEALWSCRSDQRQRVGDNREWQHL